MDVFMTSNGMTQYVLTRATSIDPGIKYNVGIFSSSGILFIFLIDIFISKSASKKLTQATLYLNINGPIPLNNSLYTLCWPLTNPFIPTLYVYISVIKNVLSLSNGHIIKLSIHAIVTPVHNF